MGVTVAPLLGAPEHGVDGLGFPREITESATDNIERSGPGITRLGYDKASDCDEDDDDRDVDQEHRSPPEVVEPGVRCTRPRRQGFKNVRVKTDPTRLI